MAEITLFYAPQTRATGVKVLLEELGASYELKVLDLKAGEQKMPAYLQVNPLGKVPAVLDRGELVTEQGAIFIYLADRFRERGLAPALDDAKRGPYLRWMAYYGSAFEPAVVDRAMKREPGQPGMSPYGDYDSVIRTVAAQLGAGPYLLGETFSAADILWGMALSWTMMFEVVPKDPVFLRYTEAFNRRPIVQRVTAEDAALAAAQSAGRTSGPA